MFNSEGQFLYKVAEGHTPYVQCVAFANDESGDVYLGVLGEPAVLVCGSDGIVKRKFGSKPTDDGGFKGLKFMAVDSKQGLLFFTTSDHNRVQVVTLDGAFVRAWGGSGEGDGMFRGPEA